MEIYMDDLTHEFPYEFLKDEELNIDFFSKENLVPEKNFT